MWFLFSGFRCVFNLKTCSLCVKRSRQRELCVGKSLESWFCVCVCVCVKQERHCLAGLPEHPQHVARPAGGEVERPDLQLPAGVGLHPVAHPRLGTLLQWARLRAIAVHALWHCQLTGVWRQHPPSDRQMGHVGAAAQRFTLLQGGREE